MNRLFDMLKPTPETDPTPDPEAQARATQDEQVKLQSQIDQLNAKMNQWNKQLVENKNKAREAKRTGNIPGAKMFLQQNQLIQTQIDTAMNSASLLLAKQASLTKSVMLADTHSAIQGANQHITQTVSKTNVREIERSLMQNDKLDGDLGMVEDFMRTANPMNGRTSRKNLDAELDALSLSDDEGVEYDFPDVKFPVGNTSIATSTSKSMSAPAPVRTNNTNTNTNSASTTTNRSVLDLF